MASQLNVDTIVAKSEATVTVNDALDVNETLNVDGATTLNGAVALGNSAADAITVPGTVASNVIFTDDTYDIGAAAATRPRDLHLSRNAVVGSTIELGHATDTTLSRTAAGRVAIETLGIVKGPASSVDNTVPRFDSTTGELIQGSSVTVADSSEFNLYPATTGGSSWARKNAIIGGDFSTNPWQRGTSFTAITSGAYSADRWQYSEDGDAVHTLSRSADAPTVAQAGRLTNHCLLLDCTTIDAAIAAGDYVILQHKIEGYNFLPLAQRAMTISFWHKHTKTGTYCVGFVNSGLDRSYVIEYTQDVTDTWEYHSATITASPSAGTWDYTTGIGIQVIFGIAGGSTFQTTANAWQTGNFFATSNQVNAADSTANNFRIALVQLEAGSVATEFESRTVQEELALCQRYATSTAYAASVVTGYQGQCITTTDARLSFPFPVPMRTTPSLTVSSAGDFDVTQANGTAQAVTGLTLSGASAVTGNFDIVVAANLVAGNVTRLLSDSGGAARITLSAEL